MRKWLERIMTIVLLCVIGYCGYKVYTYYAEDTKENIQEQEARKITVKEKEKTSIFEEEGPFEFTREMFNEYKALNPDFVGYMAFDDEFVSEPIVQEKQNNEGFYLTHWIDGQYNSKGTVFIGDYSALSDTNITLYGHNVFRPGATQRFTNMAKLVNQEEYDEHNEFTIWYEDYKCRYLITNIYYYNEDSDVEFQFSRPNFFKEGSLEEYVSFIDSRNLIQPKEESESGVPRTYTADSHMITMQTCRELNSSRRILFTCKELSREKY